MSARKLPARHPASFFPQDRPSIIGMTANYCDQMSRKSSVKISGNDRYIDGVPLLEWGKWRDCTYCGALLVLMNTMGICATYEEIMGLTASAFRFSMSRDWDPSSTLLQVGINAEKNCSSYFGLEAYEVEDERMREYRAIHSISKGIPLLICGGRYSPEWSLVTGYESAQDVPHFFGRSYFDYQGASAEEVFTENQYFLADHYPGEYPSSLFHLYDRQCSPKEFTMALRTALEMCLSMFQQPENERLYFGYDAYEFAAASLEKNEYANIRHHFISLLDARRAAYVFLAQSARNLTGDLQTGLATASAQYKEMFDLLSNILPYRDLNQGKFDGELSPSLRKRLAKTLRKMSELERKVRHTIGRVLDQWE